MHRRIALTLAIAWSTPVLSQGTTGAQVPPEPTSTPAASTDPAPSSAPLTTPAPATSQAPLRVQAPAGKPVGGATTDPPDIIIIDPEGPGTDRGESSRVRLPPPGPGREAFIRDFLRVDPKSNTPFVGHEVISASEFYGRIGRPDLVAASDGQTRKRIWLMALATAVTAGGVTAGVVVLGNAQSLNDPACFVSQTSYNNCVDRSKQTTLIGGLMIAGAVAVGGGILTWALTTSEMVTPPQETVRLATEYNRNLAIRHGAPSGAKLELLPSIGPGGASLSARLTF
jgi:hypothetical protein